MIKVVCPNLCTRNDPDSRIRVRTKWFCINSNGYRGKGDVLFVEIIQMRVPTEMCNKKIQKVRPIFDPVSSIVGWLSAWIEEGYPIGGDVDPDPDQDSMASLDPDPGGQNDSRSSIFLTLVIKSPRSKTASLLLVLYLSWRMEMHSLWVPCTIIHFLLLVYRPDVSLESLLVLELDILLTVGAVHNGVGGSSGRGCAGFLVLHRSNTDLLRSSPFPLGGSAHQFRPHAGIRELII